MKHNNATPRDSRCSRRTFAASITALAAGAALAPFRTFAQPAPVIRIDDVVAAQRVVPISMEGFSGEAANVLRYDLEVLGFEIVARDKAEFHLTGNNDERVEGRLFDRANSPRLARAYNDHPMRVQAHRLANDVVFAIRGTQPIFLTRIAFRMETGKVSEIVVSDYDGHNLIEITSDRSDAASPSWVPGQRKLFYTSYKTGFADILSHDLTSGRREAIAKYRGSNLSPSVSPDGRRVAMILSPGGTPNLYVASIDGSGLKRLTSTKSEQSSPAWSPDGQEIVVASSHRGRPALYRISANGGEMRQIRTQALGTLTEPSWSPDGKEIIFTVQTRTFDLWKVSADGGHAEPLVAGEDPSWAPNSRTVVFTRRQNNRRILSLLDVPTKRVKDVRQQQAGSRSQPNWAR